LELSAILLARSIALVDINDLNPRGTLFFPSLVPLLVERFQFQNFPREAKDFNDSKGVVFGEGYFDGQQINDLTIYSDGLKIETRSSTTNGRLIIVDTLNWLAKTVGLTFREDMISRWAYVSQLTFHSDVDLVFLNSAQDQLSARVSAAVEDRIGVERKFVPAFFALDFDKIDGDVPMSPFTIERRAKSSFDSGKFFSASPLETDEHISCLLEFEKNMRSQHRN
jgi:hypothetical protein